MAKKESRKHPRKAVPRIYPARVKAGIALVLLMLVASIVTLFREQANAGQDVVSLNASRFEGLRKALPARGTVGYVSDVGGEDPSNSGAYFLTQYFLAPVLVSPKPDRDLVVGNFSSSQRVSEILQKHNLAVAQDFRNGVLLLRREKP